jgi:hypothetical protein
VSLEFGTALVTDRRPGGPKGQARRCRHLSFSRAPRGPIGLWVDPSRPVSEALRRCAPGLRSFNASLQSRSVGACRRGLGGWGVFGALGESIRKQVAHIHTHKHTHTHTERERAAGWMRTPSHWPRHLTPATLQAVAVSLRGCVALRYLRLDLSSNRLHTAGTFESLWTGHTLWSHRPLELKVSTLG